MPLPCFVAASPAPPDAARAAAPLDDVMPVWLVHGADGSVAIHAASDPERSLTLTRAEYDHLAALIALQRPRTAEPLPPAPFDGLPARWVLESDPH